MNRLFLSGAGEGNRTLDASLGSSNFTIKLHLQINVMVNKIIILRVRITSQLQKGCYLILIINLPNKLRN